MKKQVYLSIMMALALVVSGVHRARAQCTVFPTAVSVATVSCTSANATWSALPGVTGYEYIASTMPPSGPGTPTTSSAVSLTGLTPSTIYFLYVRTECTPGVYSPWTSPITFVTPACSCAAPVGFTVAPISCDSIGFVWSAPVGSSGIEYVVNTSPSAPSGSGTPASGGSAVVGGLSGATVYYVHIRTDCGGGLYSSWVSLVVTTPPCPTPVCPAPTGFSVGAWGCDSVFFVWPFPGGYTNWEYVVDLSPSAPSGAGTPSSGSTAGAGGLMGATIYYVHIRTNCGGGIYSTWTTLPVTTPLCPTPTCAPPAGFSLGAWGCDSVVFWCPMPAAGILEYVVDVSPASPTGSGTPMVTGAMVGVGGLMGSTIYYVHIRTNCGGGIYSAWTTLPVTTPACSSPCPSPTSVSVTPGAESASISWVAPAGVSGYEYKVSTIPTIPTGAGSATSATSVSVSGLTPGTAYYVHTRCSCSGSGYSVWTTAYSFSTLSATGIAGAEAGQDAMTVFPNPAGNMVTVNLPAVAGQGGQLYIIAADGRMVKRVQVNAGISQIQLSDIPAGMYIIKYTDAGMTQNVRLHKN